MSDSLTIRGIKQKFYIGCTEEGLGWPQLLSIDITLCLDMQRAVETDQLEHTVDYVAVIDLLEELSKQGKWKLIEKLSADIAKATLERWPIISSLEVRTAKRISEKCDDVVCSYSASR